MIVAFILFSTGFCVMAAIVPSHFWLADAHAVAPTPACILFSGVMVVPGMYGLARVYWTVFVGVMQGLEPALRLLLLSMSVLTAIVGALMCFVQHHLKRLLAFSTVSHTGLLMIGIALLTPRGLAGASMYALAHGFVKASLFLCVGIILHRYATVEELKLRGNGKELRLLGAIFVLGGLALAGLPPWDTFPGKALIEKSATELRCPWVSGVFLLSSALWGRAAHRGSHLHGLGTNGTHGPTIDTEATDRTD